MHKLTRHVCFSISPFLSFDSESHCKFSFSTSGDGLSIFFELCVELAGQINPTAGFIVNVNDIDEKVYQHVVPIFTKQLSQYFQQGRHIGTLETAGLLKTAWQCLADKFSPASLSKLTLLLNPFRKITIDCEDQKMIYYSEKFEFAATHKLWNDNLTEQRNYELFGKCANPSGHGHNYVAEVTIKTPPDRSGFSFGDFSRTVETHLTALVDHKNLNVDVPYFTKAIPTVENIAAFAWEKLVGKFGNATLHCITIWETNKTHCSYYG